MPRLNEGLDMVLSGVREYDLVSIKQYTLIAAAVLTVILFWPLMVLMGAGVFISDFRAHAGFAAQIMYENRFAPRPPLLHLTAIMARMLVPPLPWGASIALITAVALLVRNLGLVALTFSVATTTHHQGGVRGTERASVLIPVALSLLVVGPIWSPEIGVGNFYIGKFSPNVWHNPTIILSSAFSVWFMNILLRFMDNPTLQKGVIAALLLALSTAAKPNFAIALLCCFPILLCLEEFRNSPLTRLLAFSFPAIVGILSALYLLYSHSSTGSVMHVMPFYVIGHRSAFPVLSILMSLGFPLTVTCLIPGVWRCWVFKLSWLLFLVAAVQALTLVEGSGHREFMHGNWYWGAHETLAILFAASAGLFARHYEECRPARRRVIFLTLLAHVFSGAAYLLKQYLGGGFA